MKLRHLAGILLLICSLHTCKKFEPSHYLLVRTEDVSDISFTTVKFNGLLLDVPEEEVSEHGFCWSVNSVPEVDTDSSVLMGAVNEAGEFKEWNPISTPSRNPETVHSGTI